MKKDIVKMSAILAHILELVYNMVSSSREELETLENKLSLTSIREFYKKHKQYK